METYRGELQSVQDVLQVVFPVRHQSQEGLGLGQVEHTIGRARGRAIELFGAVGLQTTLGVDLVHDLGGELEPGAFAAVRDVVDIVRAVLDQ